jgi:hypothetical protein
VTTPPSPVNGTIAAPAWQTANYGFGFTPTWVPAPGSLVAGKFPTSSVGGTSFNNEGCAGPNYLTDGSPGWYDAGNWDLASGGNSGGTSVTYALGGPAGGYSLNEVVVYAGWADTGRDSQGFTVSYSTVNNPGTFVPLTSPQTTYNYSPSVGSIPNADRLTITSSSGSPLATGVASVMITFTSVPNGWSGYGQIQLFGVPTLPPSFTSTTVSGGKLMVTGANGTPGAAYTLLTTTNLALPVSAWTTNSAGVFDSNGAFSVAIPILATPPESFFRVRTP